MKYNISKILLLFCLVLVSSCKVNTDFIYLQDVQAQQRYMYNHHEAVVHPGDKLNITVSCKNPELAIPFNSNGGVVMTSASGRILDGAAQAKLTSYLVDSYGNIEFPILGTLHVEGMTSSQVQDLIKNEIISGEYLNNPLVTMEFVNFKYTVMGAVSGNGEYTSESGRVTLLEALAKAGDLTAEANSKRILVYREENGALVMYEHDITNSKFFGSPCYYLQQNDLVYVEPKHPKSRVAEKTFRIFTVTLSTISAITSLLYLWIWRSK